MALPCHHHFLFRQVGSRNKPFHFLVADMKAQWPLQGGFAHRTIPSKLLQHFLKRWISDLENLVSKLGSACVHTPPVDDQGTQQLFWAAGLS